MRLLITGSTGQLGTELVRQATAHTLCAVSHDTLNITDAVAVQQSFDAFKPDVVINAAAYTAVDRAEEEAYTAFAVNCDGPANLAASCARLNIPLVHVSTDYVFDGSKVGAYTEDDPVAPLGVYGESKLAGEAAVCKLCPKHMIFRTSWVFSAHGNNFVKTMLRLAADRAQLGVVADQFGKPTSAGELARVMLALLPKLEGKWGTYHLAQPEVISWHGFALATFEEARAQGVTLKVSTLNAIETKDYPTPAKRPANSELDCSKLGLKFGVELRPWLDSLREVINELKMQDSPRSAQ